MKAAVTVLSSALTAAAALPYILDIVRGRARPRIASWGSVDRRAGDRGRLRVRRLAAARSVLHPVCAAGCAAVVFLGGGTGAGSRGGWTRCA